MNQSMQRLSTGLRINSAADDAAGLAITSKMTSQIRGLTQAVRNAQDAISMLGTAEGAMQEVTDMLQRMRELSIQSLNDTNTTSDRDALNLEYQALKDQIDKISEYTQWNGRNLLDGSQHNEPATFQVGGNAGQTIAVNLHNVKTTTLGDLNNTTVTTSYASHPYAAVTASTTVISYTAHSATTPNDNGGKAYVSHASAAPAMANGLGNHYLPHNSSAPAASDTATLAEHANQAPVASATFGDFTAHPSTAPTAAQTVSFEGHASTAPSASAVDGNYATHVSESPADTQSVSYINHAATAPAASMTTSSYINHASGNPTDGGGIVYTNHGSAAPSGVSLSGN